MILLARGLFVDTSFVQEESFGGSHYWLLAVDDATDFCFSQFMKMKDQTSAAMILLIRDLKNNENVVVKKICCNNAKKCCISPRCKERRLGSKL